KEAREIMASNKNLLKPADGSPILHIEQDIVLGCYYLTYERPGVAAEAVAFSSLEEAIMAYDAGEVILQSHVRVPFRGEVRQTTLDRLLFNENLPEDFKFKDVTMSTNQQSDVMSEIYVQYGPDVTAKIADDLKDLGFEYATFSGLSLGMDDFIDISGLQAVL